MRFRLTVLLLIGVGTIAAQYPVTVARAAMGTPWSVTVFATDTLAARRVIDSAYARVEEIEQSMSDYRTDSEINRLVRLPPRSFYAVSDDLYRVLRFSRTLARRTRGAFDPTVGPLTKLWRRAFRQREFPPQQQIEEARSRVRWKHLRLRRDGRVWLARDSLQLDLGGIAKGYALDAVGKVLRESGHPSFLVDGGGDLLLGDAPPDRNVWRVETPIGTLDTANVAIATSGARFRFLDHDGRRYSHIIDPRTGYGVTSPREVTVIAPAAMLADALASAASVLGERAKRKLESDYDGVSVHWSDEKDRKAKIR